MQQKYHASATNQFVSTAWSGVLRCVNGPTPGMSFPICVHPSPGYKYGLMIIDPAGETHAGLSHGHDLNDSLRTTKCHKRTIIKIITRYCHMYATYTCNQKKYISDVCMYAMSTKPQSEMTWHATACPYHQAATRL